MAKKSKRTNSKKVAARNRDSGVQPNSSVQANQNPKSNSKPHSGTSPASNPITTLDHFLEAHSKWVFGTILALFIITGLGLFDAYIVPMADDATYITQPLDLIQKGVYPTYTSVFYTVVMAIPAALFGVNILAYKAMSFLFGAAGLFLLYGYFRQRIPASVLFATLFIYATNYEIQFYNSALMSESFFIAFQMLFFGVCLKIIERYTDNYDLNLKTELTQRWYYWVSVGLLFVLFSVTKNLAIICAILLALFFVLHKRLRIALFITGLFIVFRALYSLAIKTFFDTTTVTGQFDTLLLKNMYDPSQGNEDLIGMIVRYGQNFNYYISDVLLRYLGVRQDGVMLEPWTLFSIGFALLCLYFVYRSYQRKDHLTMFTGLYLMGMMSVVFISLQFHWKQDRQLIIFLPMIVLFLFNALYRFARDQKSTVLNWGVLILLIGIPILQLRPFPERWENNAPKREAFLKGDLISGYTPDWQNYYRMSNWAVENLPAEAIIGVRKAATSFVFTGGEDQFIRIGASTRDAGDVVLQNLKAQEITHLMACSLRLNPEVAIEGQIIGTLYSYLRSIYAYNPEGIRLVHTIGNSEPCYLYQIVYE